MELFKVQCSCASQLDANVFPFLMQRAPSESHLQQLHLHGSRNIKHIFKFAPGLVNVRYVDMQIRYIKPMAALV